MTRRVVALALVVAGPLGWASHLLISYALVPASCTRGSVVLLNVLTIVIAMLIALAVVIGVARSPTRGGGSVARSLVSAREIEPDMSALGGAIPRLGVLLAVYFTALVVLIGFVALIVDPCA